MGCPTHSIYQKIDHMVSQHTFDNWRHCFTFVAFVSFTLSFPDHKHKLDGIAVKSRLVSDPNISLTNMICI